MAHLATQNGPPASVSRDGSRTVTLLDAQPVSEGDTGQLSDAASAPPLTLRLRPARRRNRPHVAWDQAVVDNEDCGRKKSKICCIYHKPKPFDESSSESSDSESDSSGYNDRAKPSHRYRRRKQAERPRHNGEGIQANPGSAAVLELEDGEPNAYEVMSRSNKGKRNAAQD